MLTLTPTAVAVVNRITTAPGVPDGSGLRISADSVPEGQLLIEVASTPADGDEVIVETGARVFLAEDTTSFLDDKVLDAAVDDQGGAQFVLAAQSTNGDTPGA